MKTKLLSLLFLCIILCCFVTKGKAQVSTRDSLALVDFYNSTNGPNWTSHTNWLTAKPLSTWYGITVRNNRVVSVALGYNGMVGTLPSSIGNLDSLQTLSITNNYTNLTGALPSTIGNLHRLTSLVLNDNGFIGSIPYSIGGMDSLQTLTLSNNSLSGTIPQSMGQLKKLVSFDASYNRDGSGHISGNGISGTIPDSIGFCTNLSVLNLGYNSLRDGLPSSFTQLTHLTRLELFVNKLSGPLTNVFSTNSELSYLNLTGNRFSGGVPAFFSQFTHLTTLQLGANLFSGTIPVELSDVTSLVLLDLSSNQLTGTIPAKLNNLPALSSLNLSLNKLTGKLPLLLHNYSIANPYLDVSYNQLTNNANPQWSGAKKSGIFDFAGNRFTFDGLEYFTEKYFTVNSISQAPLKIMQQGNELRVDAGGTLQNNTYYWYRTGQPAAVVITGQATFQPAISGNYYVNVKNKLVKDLTLTSDTVTYTKTSSVNTATQPEISFYPNPVKNTMTITGLNNKGNESITVADMSGNVWVKTMSRQQSNITVDVSRLKVGQYVITINNDKEIRTTQFIKE